VSLQATAAAATSRRLATRAMVKQPGVRGGDRNFNGVPWARYGVR
jgi:hypothetical protein